MSKETDSALMAEYFAEFAKPKMKNQHPLEDYILDARFNKYFGSAFKLKVDTLAAVLNGDNLNALAKANGVSGQAVRLLARKARLALAQEIIASD